METLTIYDPRVEVHMDFKDKKPGEKVWWILELDDFMPRTEKQVVKDWGFFVTSESPDEISSRLKLTNYKITRVG